MFDKFESALPPLVVAVLGVAYAWAWFELGRWVPFLPLLALVALGLAVDRWGRSFLPGKPVSAARIMEWWILAPACLAAAASGVVIVIAVDFAEDKTWSTERKELTAATVSAATAFLTAFLIKAAEDADESWVASRIKGAFESKYKGRFPPESEGARWVYSDPYEGAEGWGRSARMKRARGIAEALRAPAPPPPPPPSRP